MINKLWIFFLLSGILYAFFTGNMEVINKEITASLNTVFTMCTQIFVVMALWLGIMRIAKDAGLLDMLSRKLSKVLKVIFPEIPENHESFSFIASNIIANFFGLGSAATPFGLKAMKSLQTLNQKKDTASRSMITFLVINTSGLTIVPTTVISLRMLHKSANPTDILIPTILATVCATIAGLIMDRILARRSR